MRLRKRGKIQKMTKERQSVSCPECGKEFKHQGALNLHLSRSMCKKETVCPECGGGLRMLRPNILREKQAINKGFTEVCEKCLELI
ncbi:hypothetical protein LPY66_11365 [Dehalobacter sp. DCM]|uniref:hypothetical protein n=1 Tax=Dehalobacter sp. DCM TaxID=2907827 RepID=UPI0030821F1A|nr:hypothetical protein LPY66_11365 [Dehalobacter sp. DCM]